MIEAELKANVRDPEHVAELLAKLAPEEPSVYRDTYYDRPDQSLDARDAELRVRTVAHPDWERHLLTFKTATIHAESGSKPEYETMVADRQVLEEILMGLGFVVDIAFEKHCRNYRFAGDEHEFLATLVTVPEVGDATFLEVETMVPGEADVPAAIDAIKTLFGELGIGKDDLNARFYQDLVLEHRAGR